MTLSLALEPRTRDQIAAVTEVVRDALGDDVLAAYVYGSAVLGGLRPDSDLDILVVCARSLSADERAVIVRRLLPISGRRAIGGPARPLELTVVARPAIVPWRYPGSIELQYGEWMRAESERGDAAEWPRPDPDTAVLIESARRAAVPLIGPAPAAVLAPVPRVDLIRAMADLVPVLMPGIEEGDDRRNGLLTLARIWLTLARDEIRPKDEAADWALARLPEEHRAVLAHARAAYRGEEREDWRDLAPRVRAHVDHVVGQIRMLAAGA